MRLLAYSLAFCRANQLASVLEPLANESALWQFSLVEPLLIDWSRPYVAHTSQQKERIARVTRKRLCNQTNTFSHRANLIRVHHNSELERIDGFEKLKTLGADDDTEPALVVVENGDRGITMNAFARSNAAAGLPCNASTPLRSAPRRSSRRTRRRATAATPPTTASTTPT